MDEDQPWALVACTIFAPALLHGATSFVVDRHPSRHPDEDAAGRRGA